jgi:tetratricopeptide (TPR) repeat protein
MGDSAFRRLRQTLKKQEPPAHILQRDYHIHIPWYRKLWDAIQPPAPVSSKRQRMNQSQRRMLLGTVAVIVVGLLAWAGFSRITNAPLRAQSAFQEGMRLQAAGNFPAAITVFGEAISISANARMYLERGNAHNNLGHAAEALDDWNRALAMDAQLAEAYTARSTYYSLAGDRGKALLDLDASLRIAATVNGFYQRGQVQASLGQYDKAVEDYSRAIDLRPTAPYIYSARGEAKRALGDEAGFLADQRKAQELQDVR